MICGCTNRYCPNCGYQIVRPFVWPPGYYIPPYVPPQPFRGWPTGRDAAAVARSYLRR